MSSFTASQSKLLGSLVERLVRATGGQVDTVDGLRVCRSGKIRLYARGGTQYGDVFVTGRSRADLSEGLIAHEKHHRDAQWRRFGLAFGVMYLTAQVADVWIRRKPYNRYELAAEQASDWGGGYPRPLRGPLAGFPEPALMPFLSARAPRGSARAIRWRADVRWGAGLRGPSATT